VKTIERFNRAALDESFRMTFRTTFYDAVEPLQTGFDQWPAEYGTGRPHQAIATWAGARSRLSFNILKVLAKKVKNTPHFPSAPPFCCFHNHGCICAR